MKFSETHYLILSELHKAINHSLNPPAEVDAMGADMRDAQSRGVLHIYPYNYWQ